MGPYYFYYYFAVFVTFAWNSHLCEFCVNLRQNTAPVFATECRCCGTLRFALGLSVVVVVVVVVVLVVGPVRATLRFVLQDRRGQGTARW